MTSTTTKLSDSDIALALETPQLRLEVFLPYQLNRLAELVSSALSQIYAEEYGITIPEWRAVATLGQFGTMTARDIGNHSKMNKTMVSRAAASLEVRHLICRKPNPDDKREAFLTLSPSGKVMYASIVPKARAFNAKLLHALDKQERENLEILVNKLTQQASHLDEGDDAMEEK